MVYTTSSDLTSVAYGWCEKGSPDGRAPLLSCRFDVSQAGHKEACHNPVVMVIPIVVRFSSDRKEEFPLGQLPHVSRIDKGDLRRNPAPTMASPPLRSAGVVGGEGSRRASCCDSAQKLARGGESM